MKVIVLAVASLLPGAVSACQVQCRVFSVKAIRGTLRTYEGVPIGGATLRIREAGPNVNGHSAFCAKMGSLVKEVRADKSGRFKVRGLKAGDYWVTYVDAKDGESFLLRIDPSDGMKEARLTLYAYGNRCYLVDIERNVTKPPGWPNPVSKENP